MIGVKKIQGLLAIQTKRTKSLLILASFLVLLLGYQNCGDNGRDDFTLRSPDGASDVSRSESLDNTRPVVTGLSDDSVPTRSKTWTWGCSENNCTYRFAVNQSATHTFPASASYGSTTTAFKSSGSGTWYLHVQTRDRAGNESQVQSVSVTLDRSAGHWINSVAFQRIEAGSFTMGSPDTEVGRVGNTEGQVQVEITKAFEIMETELTQKQWYLLKKENPSKFKGPKDCDDHETIDGVEMCPNHPVNMVSWEDVLDYIDDLNDSLGLTGCDGTPDSDSGCYRLPTEAEWEYAARGGTTTAFSFGNDPSDLGDYAWHKDNSGNKLHKVRMKQPNPYGLYDVHGNVWEWTRDVFNQQLPGGPDPLQTARSVLYVVIRGSSFPTPLRSSVGIMYFRTARRFAVLWSDKYRDTGFRLVRTL